MTEHPPAYRVSRQGAVVTRCPLAYNHPGVECQVEIIDGGYRCQETGEAVMIVPLARYYELLEAMRGVGELKI